MVKRDRTEWGTKSVSRRGRIKNGQEAKAGKNMTEQRWKRQRYLLSLGLVLKEQLEQGGRESGVGKQWRYGGGRTEEACA